MADTRARDIADASARTRAPAWAIDVLLGIPVALGGIAPDPRSDASTTPAPWFALAVGIIVAASLPLARRRPRSMLAATTVIAALAPVFGTPNLGFVLAAAICMYRLAAVTSDRRVVLFAFLASAAVLVAGVAIAGPEDRFLAWMLQPIAFLTGAAALGEATRSRRAYIDAITERAERAERTRELEAERRVTEERLRIARDLHDAAGHQMAAINLSAGVAKNALPADPARAIELLGGIQQSARAVLGEISALLQLLRGAPDDTDGASLAPVPGWADVHGLVDAVRGSGLEIAGELPRRVEGLGGAADVVAYRVVQEGLANALKHGDGRAGLSARIGPGTLDLRIENLVGPLPDAPRTGGYGLIGMRERVESVDGTVTISREARPEGTAFVVEAAIPLAPGAAR
jgi:signal transduction histidine kinase